MNNNISQITLPNGMVIHHLNKYETDFTYQEVFEDEIYFTNGIKLEKGACVFDVGANIGMFTMFVKQVCPSSRVFSFEPAPHLYEILNCNVSAYAEEVQTFQCGLSNKEEVVAFTYYPNYSILSGFHNTVESDEETLASGVRNQLQESLPSGTIPSARMVNLLTKDKLKGAVQFDCQLRTISSMIREKNIERIDLLKIDAEKSEADILEGIKDEDWEKIDQIVMESHSQEISDSIIALLSSRGFQVRTDQEDQFSSSGIINISAIRQ